MPNMLVVHKSVILFIQFHLLRDVFTQALTWECTLGKSCIVRNATVTRDFEIPPNIVDYKRINFNYVHIPDPSLELYERVLGGFEEFIFYKCRTDVLYLPIHLIELTIVIPLAPLDVVVERTLSYELKRISMSGLVKLPDNMKKLHHLQSFRSRYNNIPLLDMSMFSEMQNLTEISIYNASITHVNIPEALQLSSLLNLRINRNQITNLNASARNFPALQMLDLSYNNLTLLPEYIGSFDNLTTLLLSHNQIAQVDMNTFAFLHQLKKLFLQENYMTEITTLGDLELPLLEILRLDGNHLTQLDVSRWNMPKLRQLNLTFNRLEKVFGLLPPFTRGIFLLNMFDNPWNCSWLEQTVRETPRMALVYDKLNGVDICYALRRNLHQEPAIRTKVQTEMV